jgi:glycosyltransferase involved in cell wall biosynthesis
LTAVDQQSKAWDMFDDRPLRVLMVSHTCQSRTEGQPKAERLAAMPEIDLKVLVPSRWRHYGKWRVADVPEKSAAYQVQRPMLAWAGPAQFYLHFYPRLGRLLRSFRPDVIDLWEEPWGLVSAHACRLRDKLLPKTAIISETEQNLDRTLPPPFEPFRRYTLRNADFLIGRSTEAIEVARSRGYGNGPAAVVPNAVDSELFRPMDQAVCRRQLGWPENGFIAGYIGRLVERKGLADFLDALEQCPADVTGAFVGDGEMQSEIARRAGTPPLEGRVRLMNGRPLAELPTVMNALDVLVLPSRTVPTWKEQFGRVIIEAHACGIPVIGTDSGAIPEVVGDGGLIVPEHDPAMLANSLKSLATDPGRARELGKRGAETIASRYTWDAVATRMRDVHHRAAEVRAKRG